MIFLVAGLGLLFARADKKAKEKDENRFGPLSPFNIGGWYLLMQNISVKYLMIILFISLGLLFIVCGLLIIPILFFFGIETDVVKLDVQKQAEAILENGITEKEVPSAVKILLELQIPQKEKARNPQIAVISLITIIFFIIFLKFPVHSSIDLRSEKNLKKRRMSWYRFVTVLLPSFIIFQIGGSIIVKYLF